MKSNKPWLPTSKKVQDGDSSAGAIFVAEPQHRKLDRGPLNNISFRSQDISNKPSSQRIKEICFHYVYKCSGKYSDSKLAARYVHQMADEILSQLECLDLQINRTEKQPSVLLALLQEFQEAFPSSSESPKKLLEQMKLLKAENDLLKQKMERLEQLHKKELANLSASAKNQLRVYQNGIIKERQFHADRLNEALNQYKSLREKERKVLEQKHQVIVEDISQQIQTLNQAHEMELKKSDDKTKRLSLLLDQSLETVRLQDEELSLLRQSLQRLEEEDDDDGDGDEEVMMKEQRLLAPANKIDNSPFEKSISLRKVDGVKYAPKKGEVADHSSSEAKKVFVDSETVTDPLLTHSIALQTRELDDTAISIQQSEAQVVQAAVKSRQYIRHAKDLKKKLQMTKEAHQADQALIFTLKADIDHLKEDYLLLKTELKDALSINTALKEALAKHHVKSKTPLVESKPHPLAHTPHFLDRADRFQLLKNPKHHLVTGLNSAGIF